MRPRYKEVESVHKEHPKKAQLGKLSSETEFENDEVFQPTPLDALMLEKNKSFLDMCGVGLLWKKSSL